MKKWIALMMACLLCGGLFLTGCGKKENPDSWKNEAYDLSLPTLGQDGWYLVFEDQFEGDGLNQNIQFGEQYKGNREIWTTSPRMPSAGKATIKAARSRAVGGARRWLQ